MKVAQVISVQPVVFLAIGVASRWGVDLAISKSSWLGKKLLLQLDMDDRSGFQSTRQASMSVAMILHL